MKLDIIKDIEDNAPDMMFRETDSRSDIVYFAIEHATGDWLDRFETVPEWADVSKWPELRPWGKCTEKTRAEIHSIMLAYAFLIRQAKGETDEILEFSLNYTQKLRIMFSILPASETKTGEIVLTGKNARAIVEVPDRDAFYRFSIPGMRLIRQ